MKKLAIFGAVMCSLAMTTPVLAATKPSAGVADPRVKSAVYQEDDVYVVTGHYGYGTTISFEEGEKVDSMSLGDSKAWQVHAIDSRNILFVKPILDKADTNLTVITNKRIYHFELSAHTASNGRVDDIIYELKFIYPEGSPSFDNELAGGLTQSADITGLLTSNSTSSSVVLSSSTTVEPASYASSKVEMFDSPPDPRGTDSNTDYGMKGDKELAPTLIFDDGEFTYLKFAKGADIPALFSVDKYRNESVINHHSRHGFIVIENVEKQITLRLGALEACVFNHGYPGDQHEFQQELKG